MIQSILLLYSFHSHHVAYKILDRTSFNCAACSEFSLQKYNYKFDTFSKTFLFGNFSFGAHELYFHVRKFRNYFVKWLFLCYYSGILCGCPFCIWIEMNEWWCMITCQSTYISVLSCLLFVVWIVFIDNIIVDLFVRLTKLLWQHIYIVGSIYWKYIRSYHKVNTIYRSN